MSTHLVLRQINVILYGCINFPRLSDPSAGAIRLAITLLLLLVLLILPSQVFAADFQLKGRTLGSDEQSACGNAAVSRHQETLVAAGVIDIEFPVSDCELKFDTVAGIAPSEPARLLFWKGRLIRMIVKFKELELEDFAALHGAFKDLYSQPSTKSNPPFRTATWRSGMHALELERTEDFPTNVGAYLTDITGWNEYQRALTKANKEIKELDRRRRSNDVKK